MIIPWLTFIAVALITYAGFLKLAARLLRYNVSWKSSFLFAAITMVAIIFHHVLVSSRPVMIRVGLGMMLLLGLVVFGGWFFSDRATNRHRSIVEWSGSLRLMALMFAMIIVAAFAIVVPIQIFLGNHLSPPP